MNKITKETFDSEISMCKKLYAEKKGCNWWKCENCWVPILLYKLYSWEVLESDEDVNKMKDSLLK